MLSVNEARERILSHFQTTATETIPLIASANRVLAVDISSANDFPTFDNSSMDGFAIRAEDSSASLTTLRVVADIPAGTSPTVTLQPGQAARITTGAKIPHGANAVIPVEDINPNFDPHPNPLPKKEREMPSAISFNKKVNVGENIRPKGTDIKSGQVVLQKGRFIKPQDLGLLATLGIANVEVYKKPRVALLSSGDELLDVNSPLEEGKIRDSNSYTLASLLENANVEVIRLGVAKDSKEAVTDLLDQAASQKADLILSSAGVSVGAYDFIKEVIEANGKMDFWKVNMRPGKPLAFGSYRGINFIGLPGNPVSAFVGFEVFVRPALNRMSGVGDRIRQTLKVRSEAEIESDGRESYLRAKIQEKDGILFASLTGHQGSGNLLSLVQADALLIIPAGVKCVPAGQEVEAFLL
ncbi:MAG: molybdopterin molybdotransferase MoeA [Anaerolineales bacterium]|nr:molybdopterin molybdotransferase MoeA [Anaerolineales bacterium]